MILATPERPDRRTFLLLSAGLGAAGVLSACTLNNPLNSTKTPIASATADLSPDVATAVEAVGLLRGATAQLEAVQTAHPDLVARLAGLHQVYAAHLDALTAAVPHGIDTAPTAHPRKVAPTSHAAQVAVVDGIRILHQKLIGLAVRAESGRFARLLGTMSAALSQQAAVIGPGVVR